MERKEKRKESGGGVGIKILKKKSDHLLCARCYTKTCAYVSLGYSPPKICHQDKYGFKVSIIVDSYFIPFNSPT